MLSCYQPLIALGLSSSFNADTIVRLTLFSAAAFKQIKLLQFSDLLFARKIYTVYGKQVACSIEVVCSLWSPQCIEANGKVSIDSNTARAAPSLFYLVRSSVGHFTNTTLTKLIVLLILWKYNSVCALWKLIHKEKMKP